VPDELHAASAATAAAAAGSRQRQQHPKAGSAAADPLRVIAAAVVENLSCGHNFLSFVPGASPVAG
jgi:hypothetical protein